MSLSRMRFWVENQLSFAYRAALLDWNPHVREGVGGYLENARSNLSLSFFDLPPPSNKSASLVPPPILLKAPPMFSTHQC